LRQRDNGCREDALARFLWASFPKPFGRSIPAFLPITSRTLEAILVPGAADEAQFLNVIR
jgi:hypothetical protein